MINLELQIDYIVCCIPDFFVGKSVELKNHQSVERTCFAESVIQILKSNCYSSSDGGVRF